ncbi:MAG TPA: hypothetical protein ENI23_15870, partial [bacterium]|nr:hypothetical protein [bacterium]
MRIWLPTIIKISVLVPLIFLLGVRNTEAQTGQVSFYASPAQGTFESGSTFNLSIFLNTRGNPVNTVKLDVSFPSDKLQIVNPAAGNSFISLWVTQPVYSNTFGTMSLQGGLPSPGINTSAGLISTITFRAKAPGTAVISILNSSQALANDGQGTDLSGTYGRAVINIKIPAPEGPIVTSISHGDQNIWYRDTNPAFSWTVESLALDDGYAEGAEYSWSFDQDPTAIPDNDVDGNLKSLTFEGIESGIWYLHIKARVGGVWGQTTHYVVHIDNDPPASFVPTIDPFIGSSDIRRL